MDCVLYDMHVASTHAPYADNILRTGDEHWLGIHTEVDNNTQQALGTAEDG